MVYLIHFHARYRHAGHYIGFAENEKTFKARIEHHRDGSGARLMQVVTLAGIDWEVSRTWPDGTREDERRLKNRKNSSQLCPICRGLHENIEKNSN